MKRRDFLGFLGVGSITAVLPIVKTIPSNIVKTIPSNFGNEAVYEVGQETVGRCTECFIRWAGPDDMVGAYVFSDLNSNGALFRQGLVEGRNGEYRFVVSHYDSRNTPVTVVVLPYGNDWQGTRQTYRFDHDRTSNYD